MNPASVDRVALISWSLSSLLVLVWLADFAVLFLVPITKESIYLGPHLGWFVVALLASVPLVLINICWVGWLYFRRHPWARQAALLLLGAVILSALLIVGQTPVINRALEASA